MIAMVYIRHRGLVEFRKLRKVLVYGIREIGIDDIREIFVPPVISL